MIQEQLTEPVKHATDVVSLTVAGAAFMQWLPAATAFLSLIWVGLRIYETCLNIKAKRKK